MIGAIEDRFSLPVSGAVFEAWLYDYFTAEDGFSITTTQKDKDHATIRVTLRYNRWDFDSPRPERGHNPCLTFALTRAAGGIGVYARAERGECGGLLPLLVEAARRKWATKQANSKRALYGGTLERVSEAHRLIKEKRIAVTAACRKAGTDPRTYYDRCLEATGEEPERPRS